MAGPVAKAGAKATGSVVKAPTSKKAGKYRAVVTTPAGLAKATGKVTLTLTKGKVKKVVSGVVVAGTANVTLPKLKKGSWKVSVAYAGDARYLASIVVGKAVVVKK